MKKVFEIVLHIAESAQDVFDACMAATPGVLEAVCLGPKAFKIILGQIAYVLSIAIDISEQTYAEIVDFQDGEFAGEQDASVYQNVVVIHGNVISTFTLVQQLKVMLGGIQDGLANDKDEKNRRLQLTDCTSTVNNYILPCNKPSCEDPTRLCDGSLNYKYISQLKSGKFYTIICLLFFSL